ncbi:hypothetical protein EYZ11_005036 [Aspergillus tanneri]|uniref:J domain-containing protein n=1 Tax=Aspergillus tanneri TaxID=1220188 RepID=A0A4S3JPT9_9EURO|nr:uncharacterized protein ATNIH1004_003425 [Aspergillus tanneri]KAA8650737.1 hypothetical protein ATNIH1004_003425 [Aspergillus tanneri]THC95481.1 hypothetical protein EYZ11_005036 [Aspergillus tanneri]
MATIKSTEANPPAENTNTQDQPGEYSRSGKGKFRFKSSKSTSRSGSRRIKPYDRDHDTYGHRHRHHHSSKRHRHRHARSPSPTSVDQPHSLSADTAFRESLFDALGDDEGAAYWESVYGQPIHNFAVPSVPKGPNGELEQMSDEEYASYVRRRMWERTREGMLEEQERLRKERIRQKKREERWGQESREKMQFERAMEESLRRGQERRRLKAWKSIWEAYLRSWDEVDKAVAAVSSSRDESDNHRSRLRNLLFWPVETGKRKDVSRSNVEDFMRHTPFSSADSNTDTDKEITLPDLLATLKSERVRWHPDKIQHRYGALGIDEVVMRSVTEVFQIIDTMWNELKPKHS